METLINNMRDDRDIAIIGMACRVAGDNNSPEQLWESLLNRRDASGEMPTMRWGPYHGRDRRNLEVLSKTISRGYFLSDLEGFDARFFGISPMEAEQMDPQQRISLEVSWEAVENAGLTAETLSGTDTAVFWGVNSDDYSRLLLEDLPNIEPWMGIGSAYCGIPNRVSHHLNLNGPSTAVDAACASSLVAVHQAVQAILHGESKVAIAGGVNALCTPGMFCALQKAGALSPNGSCCSFDQYVCGYGRGEGVGAVILKSLSQAMLDGDRIMAVIKGTAVAHDGKTNGIMAPNAISQAKVARRALERAQLKPSQIGYIEAHATSTPLGDATELFALKDVYGTGRSIDQPCFIGSIKPNIGHLEAGAGIMGLIKAVMAVERGVIPPQTNLMTLTTAIDWETSGLRVAQEQTVWQGLDGPRRAAVCSYGYGGTVSHAIIEQFIHPRMPTLNVADGTNGSNGRVPSQWGEMAAPYVLLVSGCQPKRLSANAQALQEYMRGAVTQLANISATLAFRRDHDDYRAALVVDDGHDALQSLDSLTDESVATRNKWNIQNRVFRSDTNRDIVFVFSGHGAQWNNMGKLLLQNRVFRDSVQPLDSIVYSEIGVSPIQVLRDGDSVASDLVQILIFIMQIGISEVLKSYAVEPQAIIGHSVGEIAASVVAGVITPAEGILIVTRRSMLYRRVMGEGAMIMVNRGFDEMNRVTNDNPDLAVAIDVSPSWSVISGPVGAVSKAAESWKRQHPPLNVINVKTDIYFHSPKLSELADPLQDALEGVLNPLESNLARCKLYSTSSRNPRCPDARDAAYWANNMVSPVRLTQAVQAAVEDSYRIFVEISSHPIVSHSISDTLLDAGIDEWNMVPTLLRGSNAKKCILTTLAQLHCVGVPINWSNVISARWATGVPGTQWMHQPTWRKVNSCPNIAAVKHSFTHDVRKHTLLGKRRYIPGADVIYYTTRLDSGCKPFPGGHPVLGTEIVPAAVLFNTLLKAAGTSNLENVNLRTVVAVPTCASRVVQVIQGQNSAKILSRLLQDRNVEADDAESAWTTHTTATWNSHQKMFPSTSVNIALVKKLMTIQLSDRFAIEYLAKVGVSTMAFPWAIMEHHRGKDVMLAKFNAAPNAAEDVSWDKASWAPWMDAATSVASTIFQTERLRMPAHVQKVDIFTTSHAPKVCWLYVELASEKDCICDMSIVDTDGNLLLKFTHMRFSEIEGSVTQSCDRNIDSSMEGLVHSIAWVPAVMSNCPIPLRHLIIISEDSGLIKNMADLAVESHLEATTVFSSQALRSTTVPQKDTAIVYVPGPVSRMDDVSAASQAFTWQLLEAVKFVIRRNLPIKVFVVTSNAVDGGSPTALAHSPLIGLSRVLASEHPDQFGGLVDKEASTAAMPIEIIRRVHNADIIRIRDGIPTLGRLQPLPMAKKLPATLAATRLMPRPGGTYLITGGLGALGLEMASFLASKSARRIVLLSRRRLPPRNQWQSGAGGELRLILDKIKALEELGVSIHMLALDIGTEKASQDLQEELDRLGLPPIAGVIHAAGVVDNQLALDTTRGSFARVLTPKINGSLALHQVFPPGSLDFFVLFSSCGQLIGLTGQSSYASANSFLDALAAHRRALGDDAVSFLWTSWRGLGMSAGTNFIAAEIESKGITDVTRDEALAAWVHLSKYDIGHGVVLRSLDLNRDDMQPLPILSNITIRRPNTEAEAQPSFEDSLPDLPEDLEPFLLQTILACVAKVLHVNVVEVDPRSALSDMGIDSVMSVLLRRLLQQALKVKVPPTLTWSHPTVDHMVKWFCEKM